MGSEYAGRLLTPISPNNNAYLLPVFEFEVGGLGLVLHCGPSMTYSKHQFEVHYVPISFSLHMGRIISQWRIKFCLS